MKICGKKHEEMQTMHEYLRVAFNPKPISVQRKNPVNQLVHGLISFPTRWRLDHDFCAFPFELRLKNAANKFIAPPKPKVDAHMLETEVVTC
jgi:hypothetical protein